MPWKVVKDTNACPADKPWAVKNSETGSVRGRCHATEASAINQQKRLYAMMKRGEIKGSEEVDTTTNYLAFAENSVLGDDGLLWIEALPAKTWHTPVYGEVPVTREKLDSFIRNFNDNVRGQEVMTGYEHGLDVAKGNKASGTYKKFEIRPNQEGIDSLWAGIEPTPTALEEIKNKEWKYFSLEWDDEWTHPETQQVYNDVIVGGALTNRPVAKGMLPINFSEVFIEADHRFAATKTKDSKKPYGSVTYADPGYQADGKKRYPLDTETHIRAAWSYINMPKNAKKYSSSELSTIKGRIRSAMKRIGAELKMAELEEDLMPIEEATRIVKDEVAPEEHQEPGTDNIDPTINEDDSADGGWRRDTPPAGEDGTVPDRSKTVTDPNNPQDKEDGGEITLTKEELEELRTITGIDEHGDVVSAVKAMSEELKPLRELRENVESQKKFEEEYPAEARKLAELEEESQRNFAKQFSESFEDRRVAKRIDEDSSETTTLGFSALVLEEIQKCTKEFSEGKPTFESFKAVLDAVMDNGIVDYGNKGSDRQPESDDELAVPGDRVSAGKLFAEKVKEIQEKDELDFDSALAEAANRHPKLAEAWRQPTAA